jgi:hypothetical protein
MEARSVVVKFANLEVKQVDIDAMVVSGVLTRAGAWYVVRNIHDLPENVRQRIEDPTPSRKG